MRSAVLFSLSLAGALSLAPSSSEAQQWTPAERAVWSAVEESWDALRAEDIARFMDSFHPQFLGWSTSRQAPLDLAAERRGTEEFLAQYDWVSHTIEPVAIRIVGEDAIVHYRYREVIRPAAGGTPQQEDGKATQVMRRLGERWKTLTIMSGPIPKNHDL